MLMKMKRRRPGTDVGAVIDAGERVHRVLPQVTKLGRLLHRQTSCVFKRDLVHVHRTVHVKQNAAGILANGLGFLFRQRDIALDDFQRRLGDGSFLLPFERVENRFLHVVGNLSGGPPNQFNQ